MKTATDSMLLDFKCCWTLKCEFYVMFMDHEILFFPPNYLNMQKLFLDQECIQTCHEPDLVAGLELTLGLSFAVPWLRAGAQSQISWIEF